MMRMLLFGHFHVERDGLVVVSSAHPSRNAKRLLKLLGLRPDHSIHKEEVLELLWPDLTPRSASNNLYKTLHLLRTLLDPTLAHPGDSRLLTLTGQIMRFAPPEGLWVDVHAFSEILSQSSMAPQPVALLESAVALYRGLLSEDDPYEEWIMPSQSAYQQQFADVLRRLAIHYRQQLRYDAVISTLRRVLADDPTDETAHRGLMESLTLIGQRHEALHQYERCVEVLAAELNMEPLPETTALFEQIIAGEISTQHSPATMIIPVLPPGSSSLASGPDNGGSLHQGLPPHNLRATLSTTVNRQTERRALVALVTQQRLVTMVGSGGVGKTHLAAIIAADVLPSFSAGVWWVALDAIRDPSLVAGAIGQVLGINDTGDKPLLEQLKQHLRDRRLLLVLDNFEQVLDAGSVITELLAAVPTLSALVTSRAALHIRGEHVVVVAPLELPTMAHSTNLAALEEIASIQLFVARTRMLKPNFTLSPANAAAVATLCMRLDGLPLAIELAAARSVLLTPQAMVERLEQRFQLLSSGPHDMPTRHQTLRATIDWSYDLLYESVQHLLARLSVFAGQWTLAAAEAICTDEILGQAEVLEGLMTLAAHSLIQMSEDAESERLMFMLESIREYAQERLIQHGAGLVLQLQHARYYLALAEEAEPALTALEQNLWLQRLEIAHPNLRAALAWAIKTHNGELALRLSGALWRFWWMHGHVTEGQYWLGVALELQEGVPIAVQAKALDGMGVFKAIQGDNQQAGHCFAQALQHYQALDDRHGIARALNNLANLALFQRQYTRARELLSECMSLFQLLNDQRGISRAYNSLGLLAMAQKRYEDAQALFEQGLVLDEALGDTVSIAIARSNIGLAAVGQGNFAQARVFLEESLLLYQGMDATWAMADGLEGLAGVLADQGQAIQSAQLLGAAKAIRESTKSEPSYTTPLYDQIMSMVRSQLDSAAFTAAWYEGYATPLTKIMAMVLEDSNTQ